MEIDPELIIVCCGFPLILVVATLAVLFVIWLIQRYKKNKPDRQ
ncbi:MAG: hypothetical protein WBD62_12145 [Anaerolineales bacterium]|jgi:hypothetical protein